MANNGSLDVGFGSLKGQFNDKNGIISPLRNTRRGNYWESYIARTPDGKTPIGHDARNMMGKNPDMVAHGFKEFLGDDVKRYFKGTTTATEALAMMLVIVVQHMEKQSGSKFDGFVITCPANFSNQQRQGLLKACEIAGIAVVQLITEPAAAAFAYAVRDAAGKWRQSLIACADLGHGTFDCSILEVKDGEATPISTEGVPQLGGRNFTDVLEKILLEKVSKVIGKPIQKDKLSPAHAAQVRELTELAKIDLSGQPTASVPLNFGGQSQTVEVTQAEFDEACKDLVRKMLDCIDLTMQKAGKKFSDLESFVLAGGPFNNARLQEVVADHTGMPVRVECDPATVVSYGAMLHALMLAKQDGGHGQVSLPDGPRLIESATHNVGIGVVDEEDPARQRKCSVLIKKATRLPYKRTELFRPEHSNQASVLVDILYGSEGALAAECERVTTLVLPGIKQDVQRAARIAVTFDADKNGLLKVTAKDGDSGPSESVSIQLKK